MYLVVGQLPISQLKIWYRISIVGLENFYLRIQVYKIKNKRSTDKYRNV